MCNDRVTIYPYHSRLLAFQNIFKRVEVLSSQGCLVNLSFLSVPVLTRLGLWSFLLHYFHFHFEMPTTTTSHGSCASWRNKRRKGLHFNLGASRSSDIWSCSGNILKERISKYAGEVGVIKKAVGYNRRVGWLGEGNDFYDGVLLNQPMRIRRRRIRKSDIGKSWMEKGAWHRCRAETDGMQEDGEKRVSVWIS